MGFLPWPRHGTFFTATSSISTSAPGTTRLATWTVARAGLLGCAAVRTLSSTRRSCPHNHLAAIIGIGGKIDAALHHIGEGDPSRAIFWRRPSKVEVVWVAVLPSRCTEPAGALASATRGPLPLM